MASRVGNSKLIGNRMMLSGALLFISSLVAQGVSYNYGVPSYAEFGLSADELIDSFKGDETLIAVMAGFYGLLAIGRILMIMALKNALTASGRAHPIMEFAVVTMTISVAFEILNYTLYASVAQLGAAHPEGMWALASISGKLNLLMFAFIGVSVLCSSWAMLRSELFPKVLLILGVIAGIPLALSSLFASPSLDETAWLLTAVGARLLIIWILWVSFLVWRKAPKRVPAQV